MVKNFSARNRVVVLVTDFGVDSIYAAEMKGVIYSNSNSPVEVVDFTHSITPFDILEASFVIGMSYLYFPSGSIWIGVVDPGVGTIRNGIIVKAKRNYFVGPDNGIFSHVFSKLGRGKFTVYKIDEKKFKKVSTTFHGRDIFSVTASLIINGVKISEFSRKTEDYVILDIPLPEEVEENRMKKIKGRIMYVDSFGNLISNIPSEEITEEMVIVKVGKALIKGLSKTFGDVPAGKPVAYIGSHGYLEIGINKGIAKTSLGADKGSSVEVAFPLRNFLLLSDEDNGQEL